MTELLMIVQLFFTIVMGVYFFNALKGQQSSKFNVERENKKEMEKLKKLRDIKLSVPLTEKSRPSKFEEIIGQEKGIEALKAALCGSNPQHVLIYGPPGIGKTAAARLVLEEAKKIVYSPFKQDAKFVELDATTVRFDDRGIADPLIGSVHDPIYQGAGSMGVAGIPQPKPGAVTKAHGGILFIDEIGELHPIEMNKLLKVLEDRKVFLDSAYYNSSDDNMPTYIKDVFENGLPADFRLVGATTRSPEEITPALRSRCVEIFFRSLTKDEIKQIALTSLKKISYTISDEALEKVGLYCYNGRECVNLIQLASGIALNKGRSNITLEDVEWIIENGQYIPRVENKISEGKRIGAVNGLAVYGANMGAVMPIEAISKKVQENMGNLTITGIIEEEEMDDRGKKYKRKSMARGSLENVVTALDNIHGIRCRDYDIHINFPGGSPVDGPSAGISMATAVYSSIMGIPVDNEVAMTGEISIYGDVKPVGGISAKINAAKLAGAKKIIIPMENWDKKFENTEEYKIIGVKKFSEVLNLVFNKGDKYLDNSTYYNSEILSAESENKDIKSMNGK